jgi:hypothetical protein
LLLSERKKLFVALEKNRRDMGAHVEVDIWLKKREISLKQLFSLFEQKGLSVEVKDMKLFEDWTYAHETSVDLKTLDQNRSDIFLKHFTLLHFVVNRTWNGILITSFEEITLELSFGLDTADLLRPGETDYQDYVERFYDRVADHLNEIIGQHPWSELFLAASMGVEYSPHFQHDILAMLQDDTGAARWIFPKTVATPVSGGPFLREEKSRSMVFHGGERSSARLQSMENPLA